MPPSLKVEGTYPTHLDDSIEDVLTDIMGTTETVALKQVELLLQSNYWRHQPNDQGEEYVSSSICYCTLSWEGH